MVASLSTLMLFFFSVSGLCGVAKSPTTNDHTLGPVCAFLVLGLNRDAYDGLHLTLMVALVLKEMPCVLLRTG